VSDLARALTSTGAIPPGTRLGKYEVLQRLGGGGMAEIYVARAHQAGGVVQWAVIKRILPHLARDPEFLRMFLNEAKITASLDHPNIAHVKEVGRAGDEFFLALELVHGVDLRRILRESASAPSNGIPLGPALTIVAAVADALHYAHERGIVHRDVTPSNVMVSWEGHAKVLDFGIAKAALTALTRTGTIKGKVGYMSPEQCMAEDVDRRADVFALGILLWELTLGRKLFKGDSDFAIMNQISLGRVARPTSVDPSYPDALERIVLEALALRPEDRFQTAQAFRRAVEDFAHAVGLRMSAADVAAWMRSLLGEPPPPVTLVEVRQPAPVVATTWSLPGRSRRGRTLAIGLLGGALGIAIGGFASGLFHDDATDQDADAPARPTASPPAADPTPTAVTPPAGERVASPTSIPTPHAGAAAEVTPPPDAAALAPPPAAVDPPRKRRRAKTKRKKTGDPGSSLLPPSRRGSRP
jgi:serine/threonine-protein kinase